MNVLSLFDGISCGQLALNRAGISYNNYYACEIDKFAKRVTQENFPKTFQLGDINNWKNWGFDFGSIDLIFAGFPCQAWSVAGKQKGDDDPRGELVHRLIEVWSAVKKENPNVKFLFENVKMKKEFIKYINELFGVSPILINSALVSAQNRNRLYWTNIENVNQPEDKCLRVKELFAWSRSTRYPKGAEKYVEQRSRMDGKANTLTTGQGCGSFSSRNMVFATSRKGNPRFIQESKDEKAHCLTATYYKGIRADGRPALGPKDCIGLSYEDAIKKGFRMLTPEECEFIQTIPENYTKCLSKTQRYKAIGNGWTVDVIAHILKGLK